MQFTEKGSRHQLVPLELGQLNVAASQAAVAIPVSAVAGAVTEITVPFEYEILAMSFRLSAAGSAGVFTIDPTINGTAQTTGRITVGTNAGGSVKIPRGKIRGAANSRIGVKVTTDGSWNGTTADLVVVVWAMMRVSGV